MSEIQLHAHRNENKTKRINLTANNCKNCNARKFIFVKFADKYSYINPLNGCVDSTTLTKPNAFFNRKYLLITEITKSSNAWQIKSQEDAKKNLDQ